jgi:hypothetical protein
MSYIGRSPQLGVRTRFYYTATGGETSLSGADDNGNTLVFSDGTYVDVLLNGITLVAGVDYNTGTANTISGLAALTASDVAEIVVYDVFSVGDAVSKSNGGTFSGQVNFDAGATGVQEIFTTTIGGSGGTTDWTGSDPYTAAMTVSGILSTDVPVVDINLSSVAFADVADVQSDWSLVYRVAATADDEVTFYATAEPTEDLVVQIKVVR